MELDVLARKYLKACTLPVNARFLTQRLQSHPDYPSLTALTDTLEELNIDHLAVTVDKRQLDELIFPLLAHTTKDGQHHFEIVHSLRELEKEKEAFLERWDGVVLMADQASVIANEEHQVFVKEERRTSAFVSLAAAAGLLLYLSVFLLHFNLRTFLLSLLSLSGIFICCLILLQSMGKQNAFTRQFCKGDGASDCDKVLHSKGARLSGFLSLGDLGLLYFSALFLFLLAGQLTGMTVSSLRLVSLPVFLSLLFSLFSIWYQGWVVRSWCRMCLAVVSILWLQSLVLGLGGGFAELAGAWRFLTIWEFLPGVLLAILVILLVTTAWFFYKKLYLQAGNSGIKEIEILAWKRNPAFFTGFLRQQRQADPGLWPDEVLLGREDAPFRFIIVSNPYCAPCAQFHEQLEELLHLYPEKVCVLVRFAVIDQNPSDRRTRAVIRLLTACLDDKGRPIREQLLHDWFAVMDLEKWEKDHREFLDSLVSPAGEARIAGLLQRHAGWYVENKITHTPAVYLNGYEFPKQYTISDLKILIPAL